MSTDPGAAGSDEPVEYRYEAETAWVTLNRPHRLNAITEGLVVALVNALRRAQLDGARAVVLRGTGTSFCAGHDLVEPHSSYTKERANQLQEVTRAIRDLSAPVIASVHGYAIGGGFEFVLACDLVVAAESAQFQCPEVDVGLGATGGATALLPRLVGPIRAKRLMLLGDRIAAREAYDLGLITTVVPDAELDQQVRNLVERVVNKPFEALRHAKRAIDLELDHAVEEAMDREVHHLVTLSSSDDAVAAAQQFRTSHPASGAAGQDVPD